MELNNNNNWKQTKITLWELWKSVKDLEQPNEHAVKRKPHSKVAIAAAFFTHPCPSPVPVWYGTIWRK